MLRSNETTRGQSIIETALLFSVVAAALVFFFSYIRSSVSFRAKEGADAFGHGRQFEAAACAGSNALVCTDKN